MSDTGNHHDDAKLVGFVSDEQYVALGDVAVEFVSENVTVATARSTARGAIHAELEPGDYEVVLAKPGYGAKRTSASVPGTHSFRLLSDRLMGYAWPKWTQAPETVELRVHSTEPYKVDLWRYDLEKEHICLLGWFDEHGPRAMMQILPDGDFARTGADWNRHGFASPTHIRRVAAPGRSGLYYFHVTTQSGAVTSFPLVVAPPRPIASIAVLASTNTWNAYNNFGGRSNYINVDGLPATPTVNARLDLVRYIFGNLSTHAAPNSAYPALSFDRPELECRVSLSEQATDPAAGRLASTLAPGLWRLLAWLTREDYAYDLYCDAQLHCGALDLTAYRVLVMDTHPEYWSRVMFERVKEWVHDGGGRLLYLGGNGIDCEVEFTDDALKFNTHNPDDDAVECRFHNTVEPPASLLGVTFKDTTEMTAAPYEVRAQNHWVFAGTGLRDGQTFGERTLHERVPGGASGHETDVRTPSTPDGVTLLAKGTNPNEGGAEMVCYDTASGGAGFSAGSITYTSSLLVDEHTSKITRNVLDRYLGE